MVNDEYTSDAKNDRALRKTKTGVEPPVQSHGMKRDIVYRSGHVRDANWME